MKFFLRSLAVLTLFVLSTSPSFASSKIGILVFDGFLTSDVTAPVEVFGAATKKAWFSSYEVVVISATEEKRVVSEEGLTVVADKTIYDELSLDVLIAPSSYDMDPWVGNEDLIGFVKAQAKEADWMASNCSGAYILAEAGVLDGKQATTWAGGEGGLQRDYSQVEVLHDRNVVRDEGVITSNGGPVSYQAAFELLAQLSSQRFADSVAETIQYDRLLNPAED